MMGEDWKYLNRDYESVLLCGFSGLLLTLTLVPLIVPLLTDRPVCASLSQSLELELAHRANSLHQRRQSVDDGGSGHSLLFLNQGRSTLGVSLSSPPLALVTRWPS